MYKKKYLQMKRGKEKSDKSVIAFFFCLFVLSYLLELLVLEGNQNTTHVKSRPQYVTSILTSSESITGTRAVFKSTLSSHSPFRVYVRTEREAGGAEARSEEHTSVLQSQTTISYAVFCLKKKKKHVL